MAEKTGTTETQRSSSPMESPVVYTFFMLVKTTTRWLQAPQAERVAFMKTEVMPLLKRWPDVTLRYYDAEFFTTRCTDVMVWETKNLVAYQSLIEKLRDTLFWDTYFEIVEIIPAVEVAYANLDDVPVVDLATS